LIDFCHYLCLLLDRCLFEFFWSWNFWGSCYSSIWFICGIFEFETEPKGLIYYHIYANVANKIVWSFVWRKFSSVGNGEWWDEVWTKAKAWGCPCHLKKYPIGTSVKAWEFPRGTPSSSAKIRSPFNTLYFYCFIFYAFFLERLYFCFQFSFVLFAKINGWTPTNFFWRRCTLFFIAKNTLVFTLIVQRVYSFSRTTFSFHFLPWFLFKSYFIFASRYIYTTGLCWFSSKELSQKGLNGVGKDKKFSCKKWYKKELV
jgi:hypothetical protein